MAGKSDISAGNAYVQLALKGGAAFNKGLRAAGDQLKSFGAGMSVLGAGIAAAGAGIVGPLLAAVDHFSEVGSALADMSARTGTSAGALAELGYAADMTGSSIETVEGSITKMQKLLGAAASGSKSANAALAAVGVTLGDLKGLSPDQQFQKIGEKIAAIPDPAARAAAAMKIFGKSGTQMLPMLQNLAALRKEAQDLGLAPTDEAVQAADGVGDAFDRVKKSAGAVVFSIGHALAGAVTEAADVITSVIVAVGKWVKENHALVKTVAMIGAGLVVAGGVIAAIGTAIAGAGFVLTGMAAAFSAVGAALAMVFSPLGLIAAALIGGAAYWAMYTDSGKKAVASMMGMFGPLLDTAKKTFGGIMDALKAGDLSLAGKLAMAGLKVALLQGVAAIATAVGGAFGDFLGTIGTQLISGDFAGAWETALTGMAAGWAQLVAYMTSLWDAAVAKLTKGIIELQAMMGGDTAGGKSWDAMQADSDKAHEGNKVFNEKRIAQLQQDLAKAEAAGGSFTDDVGNVRTKDTINAELAEEEKKRGRLAKGPENVLDAATSQVDKDLEEKIKFNFAKADEAAAPMRARTAGGAAGASTAADDAQRELDALREQAAAAAAAVKAADAEGQAAADEATDGMPSQDKVDKNMAGTYSAAAALASFGAGGNPAERTAKAAEEMAKNQAETNGKLDQLIGAVEEGGMVE